MTYLVTAKLWLLQSLIDGIMAAQFKIFDFVMERLFSTRLLRGNGGIAVCGYGIVKK